jgi:hypothetical protein
MPAEMRLSSRLTLRGVRTGGRVGAPFGNRNRWVHGKRSRAFTAQRKATMQLLRAVREAIEMARRS